MSASREKRKRKELSASETDPKKQAAKRREHRKDKIGRLALEIGSIVVAIVFVALLIYNTGVVQRTLNAVSIGDYNAKITELDYYYNNAYRTVVSNLGDYAASYGLDTSKDIHDQPSYFDENKSWADYFYESALETMQREYVQASAAREEGLELSDENISNIDQAVAAIGQYAANQSTTTTQYLRALYGKGITIDLYRTLLERYYLSTQYLTKLSDSFTYTNDELEAYYLEDPSIFDSYTYRSYFISGFNPDSEEDEDTQLQESMDKAEEMVSRLEDVKDPAEREDLYNQLCIEYAKDEYKYNYEDPDFTLKRSVQTDSLDEYLSEYISDSSRTYGDVTYIDGTTGYYVVMFVNYGRNEYEQVTYNQIFISPNTEKTSAWTDEEWAQAEETANLLYSMTQEDGFTIDDFTGYVATYSDDSNTVDSGGLYQSVLPGSMDTFVYEWLYESEQDHAAGDIGLVKGTDGYYIIYFDSYDGVSWETSATNALKQRDYEAWFKDASANYEVSTKPLGMIFADY